ncbi:TPA: hypothetical protein DIU27_01965 [Candidatus Collierbacteria bacterium]|uniref:HhH-GPD family protein n=1 Tax=Candidatus Collierbacteria bacterium GW2011_GWB2_44_22 TaxID=1618387 RepID=A0A0G1HY18_9BACT|nr:MAG: HhH-GPD family protein [Candidatus Collierbacteria bacterium GW2011_GWA2_44_13]KKT50715.1 MAG: HhH-GPD family protein [Candidatus Collierbacteria bacterium GW2011_GWB1_44_197]KKT52036.1 MAG: HhH-GPD family protein [Candidatus Collierbacteria bacterium GW2011_GWB2_44_22]KKT62632.1 MAG: HhH-GPD family protein [Candidatus Collierbacteria bacterium GW2011_GWD1_44_27]KKT66675.1 MAG: HhH-GPD family protein [Candidatus Collierbacteria bacterium GW2011_GWC2_44_30]KKT69367.1 MAG: HhH-GPD family
MELKKVKEVVITPLAPFDFDSTFHKPDHFTTGDNLWEPGIRWQTWNHEGKSLGLKFANVGTIDKPRLEISVYADFEPSEKYISALTNEIEYRYNLQLDLSEFYAVFKKDRTLSPIMQKWQGMKPGHPSSLYEYLIIGIVLQNTTVRRSMQMFKALIEKYGKGLLFDGKELYCFWAPGELKNVSIEDLKGLKVGYRAKSIKMIDDQFAAGLIEENDLRKKDLETQRTELLKLYGVGPATVWYLLFDVFHHLDFFNHISPWEQKIYSKIFFDADPENPVPVADLLKYFEKYGKYKQLAVHYIWEDLWWKRKNENLPWLEKLIRV